MPKLIAVGLNPAWQKTLKFKNLEFASVNRAYKVRHFASGKGINFTAAARKCGADCTVYQFAGGDTGKKICRELDKKQIPHKTAFTDQATRTCTTCLCSSSGSMTELIEPSPEIKDKYAEHLLDQIINSMRNFDGLALCGTFPPGISSDFYAEIIKNARKHSVITLLDAYQDIESALKASPDILKINSDELAEISGIKNIPEAVKVISEKYSIEHIGITNGAKSAYLLEKNKLYTMKAPNIKKAVNPLGAGDTADAAMLSNYIENENALDAFCSGLAAASASCLTEYCGEFDLDQFNLIKKNIEVNNG